MPSSTTVLQQPQGPACASLGRLGTGQGNQLGLPLAVKNPSNGRHRARLAAQHGFEAFFQQLLALLASSGDAVSAAAVQPDRGSPLGAAEPGRGLLRLPFEWSYQQGDASCA